MWFKVFKRATINLYAGHPRSVPCAGIPTGLRFTDPYRRRSFVPQKTALTDSTAVLGPVMD